jgi:hypothetical protein
VRRVQRFLARVVVEEPVEGANHRPDHLIAAVMVERGGKGVDDPVMRFT